MLYAFLKDNNALDEFAFEFIKQNMSDDVTEELMDELFSESQGCIYRSFTWEDSKKGSDYWFELGQKYRRWINSKNKITRNVNIQDIKEYVNSLKQEELEYE